MSWLALLQEVIEGHSSGGADEVDAVSRYSSKSYLEKILLISGDQLKSFKRISFLCR